MSNHSIVHVEIPAKDTQAASAFYNDLFGWKINHSQEMDYSMYQPESGPGGGFVQAGDGSGYTRKPGELLVYVSTDDIDATLAKAESLGATIVATKTEIPNTGWFGIFTDPSGNQIALYTDSSQSA